MPPFSKMPQRQPPPPSRTGLVVNVPLCDWCRQAIGFKCNGCGRITCYQCLLNIDGGKCVHQTYNPVQSTGWGDECPNPHCDTECNVCMGKGVIWQTQQRRLTMRP